MPAEIIVTIVDEKDKIIGYKKMSEVEKNDIYRVSALWLTDKKTDKILIAQRSFTKKHGAGKWGPAVAGRVEKGESYQENIIKETAEEIGLKNLQLKKEIKIRVTGRHNFFCQWFSGEVEKEKTTFILQKEEVEKIRWISKNDLIRETDDHPEKFLSSAKIIYAHFLK